MNDAIIEVKLLKSGDLHVLRNVAEDVFDNPVREDLATAFLADPRHHLVVAISGDTVVGFVSGFHYFHPDKTAEMFINETGVAPAFQRRGIGRKLMEAMLAHAETIGCGEAWVLTEKGNQPARALYQASGGKEDRDEPVLFSFPFSAKPE